jgi:hypothetical protein
VEAISDWFNRISKEVNSYRDSLSKKDFRKYKLDLLLRIAQRVDISDAPIFEPVPLVIKFALKALVIVLSLFE